jgi:hypothetical protein
LDGLLTRPCELPQRSIIFLKREVHATPTGDWYDVIA